MIKKKKYPDWAPKAMIVSLEAMRKIDQFMTSATQNKAVDYMLELTTNIEACSEEQKGKIRARHYDIFVLFPLKEQNEILEKLLTNPDMENVWKNLSKKVNDNYKYEQFWHACLEAVAGGRRVYQRTGSNHKKHFEKINNRALELAKLLEETTEMIYFPITRLISDGKIDRLRSELHVPPETSTQHVRTYLDGVIPDIQAIIYNIAVKAEEISKEKPLVKKPNSKSGEKTKSAGVQYFVRYLSRYLKDRYHQPLHIVVAATARVVFDDPDIDENYVRKIVSYP